MSTRSINTAFCCAALFMMMLALPVTSSAAEARASVRRVFPNPFTEGTTFELKMPKPGAVRIVVYDLLGKQIRVLLEGYKDKGEYPIPWDGKDEGGAPVIPGVYICVLFSDNAPIARVKVVKMQL